MNVRFNNKNPMDIIIDIPEKMKCGMIVTDTGETYEERDVVFDGKEAREFRTYTKEGELTNISYTFKKPVKTNRVINIADYEEVPF